MNKLTPLALAVLALSLTGCVPTMLNNDKLSSTYERLFDPNKDYDITVTTPQGTMVIHSRVDPQGTNPLKPLPAPAPAQ